MIVFNLSRRIIKSPYEYYNFIAKQMKTYWLYKDR